MEAQSEVWLCVRVLYTCMYVYEIELE